MFLSTERIWCLEATVSDTGFSRVGLVFMIPAILYATEATIMLVSMSTGLLDILAGKKRKGLAGADKRKVFAPCTAM